MPALGWSAACGGGASVDVCAAMAAVVVVVHAMIDRHDADQLCNARVQLFCRVYSCCTSACNRTHKQCNHHTVQSARLIFPAKVAADHLILFRHLVCPTVALAAAAAARVLFGF